MHVCITGKGKDGFYVSVFFTARKGANQMLHDILIAACVVRRELQRHEISDIAGWRIASLFFGGCVFQTRKFNCVGHSVVHK
jgi:hypothetical protein